MTLRSLVLAGVALAAAGCARRSADGERPADTLVAGAAAVAGPVAAPAAADSLALERTRCYGTCPAYRVVLDAAGRVTFASRNPGDSTRATASVAPATLGALVARAESGGFLALPPRVEGDPRLCAREATDGPSATLVIYRPSGAASVEDYLHCQSAEADSAAAGLLERLRALQVAVDSATGSARWVRPSGRK